MVVVIRYETKAAARWTLMFIVGTFINYTITIAVWTSFHVCLIKRPLLAIARHRLVTVISRSISPVSATSVPLRADQTPDQEARGVNDILIAVVDGLKGFPEAPRRSSLDLARRPTGRAAGSARQTHLRALDRERILLHLDDGRGTGFLDVRPFRWQRIVPA
jgi:hypothetical protein